MGIFSAYYYPGDRLAPLRDDMTPVSGLRILANRYLGTSLRDLPDATFISTLKQPFKFERLEPPVIADGVR